MHHKILYSTSDNSWEKSPSIRGWLDEPVVLLEHDFEYFTFYWLLNLKKAQTKRRSPQSVKMIIKRKWFIKQTLRLLVSCSNVCLGLCVYLFFLFTEDLFEIIRRVLMTILFRSKDDRPCTMFGLYWGYVSREIFFVRKCFLVKYFFLNTLRVKNNLILSLLLFSNLFLKIRIP